MENITFGQLPVLINIYAKCKIAHKIFTSNVKAQHCDKRVVIITCSVFGLFS